MQKWKQFLSGLLAGVMVLGSGLTAEPMQLQAQEAVERAVPGTVYEIYKAFEDGTELGSAWVDPEFGTTHTVTLNSSISPRVIELQYQQNEADNGKLLATFECNRLPKTDAALVAAKQDNGSNINEKLSSFPVYESIDGGRTWGAGDTDRPARGENYLPVGYVQNQNSTSGTVGMRNCPQLYEMPETIGNLTKGTILCAGNSIEAGENGNAADTAQSTKTNLDLCVSTDLGRNWNYHSTIVGPTEGLCVLLENTVWEPFFLTHDGKLYCFYSDEAFDNTTDQDLSYVVYDGTSWSEKHRIVYSRGQRPGMPVVSQLKDGRFMLTYEIEGGGGLGSGYILSAANDPTKWYEGETLKDTTQGEYVRHNAAIRVNNSGAPYNITTDKGAVLYNNTALGQIWVNSSRTPDEPNAFWRYYYTGLGSAYNRQILQLSNGNIFVVAGWDNSGVKCVTLDYEMDLAKTGYVQNKLNFNGESVYLAYNNSPLFVWTGKNGRAEENQYYEFQEVDEGVYMLISTNNGKAVAPESDSKGSLINTFAKNEADTKQHWVFEEASDGYYRVKNVAAELYLTSPRTAETDKRDMHLTLQEKDETLDGQLWKTDITIDKAEDDSNKTKYNVTVTAAEGVEVTAAKTVVEGRSLNIRVTKKYGCKSIDKILVNGEEQQFTVGSGGIVNLKISDVKENISIKAEATLDDWFVSVPTNDHHGRNQCLSPRIVEALDGTLYCTFESAIASEEADGEFVFPIYESKNKGKNWTKVGEIINDDKVHPDEWYTVKYDANGVPTEGTQVEEGTAGAIRHPWSMHNCPQLFVLPEDMGTLKAGTLLCAGDAVTIEEHPQKVSDAGYGGLWKTSLDMYYSTDGGRNWTFLSTIADGGRNIMGYTPVWEPFFLYHDDQLICYYSDETDRPAHSQKLVHKITQDGKNWGAAVDDVAFSNRNARPGMPVVTQMENGKWMMVYEGVGTSNPITSFAKIADDPYNWNPTDQGSPLPVYQNQGSGSPYVYTLQDGRVIASTGTHPEVLLNTKKDGTGAWLAYEVGAIAGYNRCYLQLSTGELLINGSKGFDQQDNYIYVRSIDPEEDLPSLEAFHNLYYITSKANDEVLGIDGGSLNNNAKAMTWTNEKNSPNQMWKMEKTEDGDYIIKNFSSDKLLTLTEEDTLVQRNAATEAGDAQAMQRWIPVKLDDGSFVLQNSFNQKYLSAESNHVLKLAASISGDMQKWSLDGLSDVTEEFGKDMPAQHSINIRPAENGTVTADKGTVENGGSVTFTITPKEGYKIKDVLVNETSVGALETYTAENVTADITIEAVFESETAGTNTYTVTIQDTVNGTITADKTEVTEGGSVTFTITPDSGYKVKDVLVNGTSVGAVLSYTAENVSADVTITAVFEIGTADTYTVTIQNTANGTITADKTEVTEGGSVTFTITPDSGYKVKDVLVNGTSVGAVLSYTAENVSADVTITAVFEKEAQTVGTKKYAVTIQNTTNGTIKADKTEVTEGGSVTFTITPASGYKVKDVLVNGTSVGAVLTYTANNVSANISISAVFEKEAVTITVPTPEMIEKNNPGLPKGNSEESSNSKFATLLARVTKSTNNSNKLQWSKVKAADGYIVLGNLCNAKGKKYTVQTLTVIENNKTVSYTHKKLKKGTGYKYIVQAYKMTNGKLEILATSKTVHAITSGGKNGNVGSLKLNKTKVSLKVGKSFTLKVTEVKKDKKIGRHRKVAFESSNTKIATISSKGVIKAKKKGTCYIYAYAQNGIYKRVKVTVKKK